MSLHSPTITLICPSIGRGTLLRTIKSYVDQDRVSGDKMVVLGDDWEGDLPSYVRFKRCHKSKFYGHEHVYNEARNVQTDYWGWIGDDDVLAEGAFSGMRKYMNGNCLVGAFTLGASKNWQCFRSRNSIPGRIAVSGWQALVPKEMELPDFSEMADTDLFDHLLLKYTHHKFSFLPWVPYARVKP